MKRGGGYLISWRAELWRTLVCRTCSCRSLSSLLTLSHWSFNNPKFEIYIYTLLVCLCACPAVCLFVFNKRQKSVRAGLSIASMNYNNKINILIKWKLNINYLDFSDSLVSPGSPFLSSTDPSSVYTQLSFSLQNSFSQYHGWLTPPWSVSSQCWCSSSTSSPAPPATTTGSGTGDNVEETKFKGTVSVISSDSKCEDGNARFTTVPW